MASPQFLFLDQSESPGPLVLAIFFMGFILLNISIRWLLDGLKGQSSLDLNHDLTTLTPLDPANLYRKKCNNVHSKILQSPQSQRENDLEDHLNRSPSETT
ncbi:hypothetical protein O181_041539 [Austropuccinia psidii MF-1]|uniref:Uncharacterized protein n=1 Tax=Austropuccinia psidii MF-1 TaxID=1389203 RepID=A0A9Q3DEL7_9BASI|nr:hypothetical protein [Austropuccinia psidii MF-1]